MAVAKPEKLLKPVGLVFLIDYIPYSPLILDIAVHNDSFNVAIIEPFALIVDVLQSYHKYIRIVISSKNMFMRIKHIFR